MQQQNLHLKNHSDEVHKAWKRTKFFWVLMVSNNSARSLAVDRDCERDIALCSLLSKDPWLLSPQDGTQPCQGERSGCSFPSPITSSLTHHNAPLLQPALKTLLCRHLPINLLSLFLAFFLSFFSELFSCSSQPVVWCRALTSSWPFLQHPPLPVPHCTNVQQHLHALAWCCPPPTCPSPTCFGSGHLACLLGVCIGQISSLSFTPEERWKHKYPAEHSAYCLEYFYQLDGGECGAWQSSELSLRIMVIFIACALLTYR